MNDANPAEAAYGEAEIVNAIGLHARPSVKLTQLAKTFACRIEIAPSQEGPWIDAKSPVKVMRMAAAGGTVLYVRAAGPGAHAAAEAVLRLVRSGFGEHNGSSTSHG